MEVPELLGSLLWIITNKEEDPKGNERFLYKVLLNQRSFQMKKLFTMESVKEKKVLIELCPKNIRNWYKNQQIGSRHLKNLIFFQNLFIGESF